MSSTPPWGAWRRKGAGRFRVEHLSDTAMRPHKWAVVDEAGYTHMIYLTHYTACKVAEEWNDELARRILVGEDL